MTMEMPYTDEVGNTYSASAWWPVQINIASFDNNCQITWYGYKDKTSLYSAMDNGTKIVPIQGAIKVYTIKGDDFKALYMQHMAPNGPNLNQLVHNQAFSTHDVETTDQNGDVVMKSFFDGATQS